MNTYKSTIITLCLLLATTTLYANLDQLEKNLKRDLASLNWYAPGWTPATDKNIYDVVIIGSGQAGMAAAFALQKLGIDRLALFDENPEGLEGPWLNYARMKTLKSSKEITGPALNIPNLTFRAWFEAQFGEDAWNSLGHIPTGQWMDYLKWYRHVLNLPIQNNTRLTAIIPHEDHLLLLFDRKNEKIVVLARKVVLATGRAGFGGSEIPSFMQEIPKTLYAHTTEHIDFNALAGRRIGIIGCGASAFDSAAEALEHRAGHVDILMRRSCFPQTSHFGVLSLPGFYHGFYQIDDEMRFKFIANTSENGIPPPHDAFDRLANFSNFTLKSNLVIDQVSHNNSQITLSTNIGTCTYDFLILATGFSIDGCKEISLAAFFDQIKLWGDTPFMQKTSEKYPERLKRFPYLGSHFEFKEKFPGSAPYLKHIYCFNYASVMSHGHVSDDIEGLNVGAIRLAEGIAADFFIENCKLYFEPLEKKDEERERIKDKG